MELTIATINELLLPPFLFVTTFCFLCCQLNSNNRHTFVTTQPPPLGESVTTPQPHNERAAAIEEILPEQEPAVFESATPLNQLDTSAVKDKEDVPVEQDADETVTSREAISTPQPELYAMALTALDKLGKREARKVMGSLKLQQKRNGVELSTELMIASIRREFKVDPEHVIAAIQERLPELLSELTNQPDQLAS